MPAAAAAAKSLQLCPTLCNPIDGSLPGSPSLGFSRQEHWSGLPFPSAMHESEKWKWSRSVASNSSRPMDCSLPGSSVHGIFQARVLECGAIAFSIPNAWDYLNPQLLCRKANPRCSNIFLQSGLGKFKGSVAGRNSQVRYICGLPRWH